MELFRKNRAVCFLLVCTLILSLGLCACGNGTVAPSEPAPEPESEAVEPEVAAEPEPEVVAEPEPEVPAEPEIIPEANVDPSLINPGKNYSRDEGTSDLWFCTTNPNEYFFLTDASLEYWETGISISWFCNGEQLLDSAQNAIVENHLVSYEDSPLQFDLMFIDLFTAYDTVSGQWYYREGMQAIDIEALFFNLTMESEYGNYLTFNDDYTVDEIWKGKAGTGTWYALNATQIVYYPDDGTGYDYKFDIYLTEDGMLDSIYEISMGTYTVAAE